MTEQIHHWIHENRSLLADYLRSLVRIDTQNLAPQGHEYDGQMAVAGTLRMLGCKVDVYEIASVPGLLQNPLYWAQRPGTGRPNVIGIRRGRGGGRSLLFSSHIDTVPVGLDRWSKAPWGGDVSDGRLWGLGSYDMKAGLAASIMLVRALNDLGIELQGDLMVESVIDEEFGGCNGTLAARQKYNADLAIVPEPTNLVVCPAHHGGLMLRVTIRGRAGWGFSPERPIDPVSVIARFIGVLNEWAAHRNVSTPVPPLYQNNPNLPVFINQLSAGDVSLPFFGDRVPSHAWLSAWIEAYPGMTQNQILDDLKAWYKKAQATDALLADFEPEWQPIRWLDGSQIPADHAGVRLLADTVTAVRGKPALVQGAPFACDGHMFNLHSPTPMVLLGPTGGQPHSPDEYIELDDFADLLEVFVRTAVEWCGVAN